MKASEKPGRTQFIMMFFAFSFGMVLSNLIAQSSAQKVEEVNPPLFVYKGIDKTIDDVSPEFKERLEEIDRKKRGVVELAALQLHTYQYAKDNEISVEEAGEALFPSSKVLVSSEQVNQFYHDNQGSIDKPFYEVKQEIEQRLKFQRIVNLKKHLLSSLEESGDLAILPRH